MESALMDAEEALDRICRIVGWANNPDPADAEDAIGEVIQVLNAYVRGIDPPVSIWMPKIGTIKWN